MECTRWRGKAWESSIVRLLLLVSQPSARFLVQICSVLISSRHTTSSSCCSGARTDETRDERDPVEDQGTHLRATLNLNDVGPWCCCTQIMKETVDALVILRVGRPSNAVMLERRSGLIVSHTDDTHSFTS